ncbi:unnamed protein product, partial [Ectocarpus sp. 12 AP-2014]
VLYIDLEFPPNDCSLGPSLAASGLVTWRRPTQFGCGSATAFGGYGQPLPSDVRPCPFAADASLACALAALVERPRLVSAALCATESGIFCARLCADGVWKEYIMDDFFPCLFSSYPERGGCSDGGGGGPCLSRAHGPALWVSMLEKAYARVVGSYSAALGG